MSSELVVAGPHRRGNARDREDVPALAAVRVTKRFGGVPAIEGVDFDVKPGEVHAVVGENGAGKSSLMNVLHGLYQPDEGHIEVKSERVRLRSPRDAEQRGIAMIPQELELFPDLSVVENLYSGRERPRNRYGAYDGAAMRDAALAIFAALAVELDVRAPVRHVSVAVRQLVAIGRALLGNARVVIMDEPTAALTEREVARLFGVIAELQERGVGIVYVSHRLSEVEQVATRVTVIRDGRRVETRSVRDLAVEEMVRLMVGRPLSQLFSRDHAPSDATALDVRRLSRTGDFSDITLRVREGEVVGLAGLIGAGRTELAQAIFGLRSIDAGEVLVGGRPLPALTPQAALARGIAYVPEERRAQGLFLPLSTRRNISFSALRELSRRGVVNRTREATLANALSRKLDIRAARPTAPVVRLSGGNQQKVLLARILALEPRILLLDEPTRGVDVGAKAEIYKLIDGLARAGKAILLISSELEEVLAMSDRILVMREGRLVAEFAHDDATPEAVTSAATGIATRDNPLVGAARGDA